MHQFAIDFQEADVRFWYLYRQNILQAYNAFSAQCGLRQIEIGELGLDEQAMLLKAIEEKRFFPMGSDREVASDFQLIAGTHRDLAVDVKSGRFREDLFARINTWLYSLPGLKDRREDIEPNLDFELERIANQLGKKYVLIPTRKNLTCNT